MTFEVIAFLQTGQASGFLFRRRSKGSPYPLSSACSASVLQMPSQAIQGLLAKEVNGSMVCCYIMISL